MKSKSIKLTLVLSALFAHEASQAQVKIVTVETKKLIEDSKAGESIREKMTKEGQKLSAPFTKIEADLKAKEASLIEKQKNLAREEEKFKTEISLLSQDAASDRSEELQRTRRDIEEEVVDFQRTMRKAQEDAKKVDQKLEQLYRKEMMVFEQEIKDIIDEMAQEEEWDIVLAKEAVIYAGKATDQTHAVIKKINVKEEKRTEKAKAEKAVKSKK